MAVVPCARQTEAARRRARSSEAELSQLRCTTGPSAVASSTGGAASGAASAAFRPPGAVVARARARSSAALCRAAGILTILVPAGVGRAAGTRSGFATAGTGQSQTGGKMHAELLKKVFPELLIQTLDPSLCQTLAALLNSSRVRPTLELLRGRPAPAATAIRFALRLRRVQKGVPWNPCPLALGSVRVRPGAPKWVELIGVVGAPHRLWVVDAYPAHQISAAAHEQQQWTDGGRVPPFAIGGPLRARSGHRVPSCSMILHRA